MPLHKGRVFYICYYCISSRYLNRNTLIRGGAELASKINHPAFTIDSRDEVSADSLRSNSNNVVETKPFEVDVTLLTGVVVGLTAALNVVTAAINSYSAARNSKLGSAEVKATQLKPNSVRINGVNYKLTPENHKKIIKEIKKIYKEGGEGEV